MNELKHYGVKGMRWGVRKKSGKPGRIKQEWDSLSRERSWKKVLNDVDHMSTKDINKLTNRIQMENDLKRLTKNTSSSRKDYLNRSKMSDQELFRKVGRLRAKDNLNRAISDASKEQVALGKKVVKTAAPLVLKKMTGQSISSKDVMNAYKNPRQEFGKTVKKANEQRGD